MDFGLDKIHPQLEKVSKLPSHYRLVVVLILPALIVGGYWWLLYRGSVQNRDQMVSEQQQLQRKLNEVRSVAANLDQFEEEIEALEAKLVQAVRQLPSSKELPGLLTDITSLGKKAGLEFNAFRPRKESQKGFYAEVAIELEFTGTYHEVASFFDRVSKLDRIVNISDLKISVSKESLEDTILKVSGRAITFRFLEGGDA